MEQNLLQLMEHMMMQIDLASVIGDSNGYGIVNINMRPYYVEGSKTLAFEILEQLNWTVPDVLVIPVGSGAMLNSICKGFEEIMNLGIISDISNLKIIAAQPHGVFSNSRCL